MISTHEFSKRVRSLSLKMVHSANASHIGSALSIVDLISVLYNEIMNIDKNDPDYKNRDRFILSKGHACVALYAALYEIGYISTQDLKDYGKNGALLMNHVSHKVPGVDFSSGALGHGLSFGVGKALAAKIRHEKWKTYVLISDGELDEGSNWEAFMFASHHKLDNLTVLIDYNKLQSLGSVASTLGIEPLVDKLRSFGCSVKEVSGHDHELLSQHLSSLPWSNQLPNVLICHTTKGKGVSFMENKVEWHYKSPNDGELESALSEINLS